MIYSRLEKKYIVCPVFMKPNQTKPKTIHVLYFIQIFIYLKKNNNNYIFIKQNFFHLYAYATYVFYKKSLILT